MADEFLTKFYLGLHDLLADSVLTPREQKFIDIITRQNAALEAIADGVLNKSPAEIAALARSNTVVIAEKGAPPVPISEYASKLMAGTKSDPRGPHLEREGMPVAPESKPEPEPEPEPEPVSVVPAGMARPSDPSPDPPKPIEKPRLVMTTPTTVGGGLSRALRQDALTILILPASALLSILAAAVVVMA